MMAGRPCWAAALLMLVFAAAGAAQPVTPAARTSLCLPAMAQPDLPIGWANGLAVVTDIASRRGRYQSYKTIVSYTASAGMRIAYTDGATVSPVNSPLYRFVSGKDLQDAQIYDQTFDDREFHSGATALGPSSSVLRALRQSGSADLSIHALTGRSLVAGRFTLLEPQAVRLPMIVNDKETELAALHVRAQFGQLSGDLWLLDDAEAPMVLMYHLEASEPDWQSLRVVGITLPAPASGQAIQETLAHGGCIAMHDIHFDFDSDKLRPEADPVLAAIADVLGKQPAWNLTIAGYTDNIGSEQVNLELSRRRANTVVHELAGRYGINPARLTPVGLGKTHFVAPNDDAVGRALNRRVEISRSRPD
jgi:outer membrane protein OmpA-like peptidoglycan-associated protein